MKKSIIIFLSITFLLCGCASKNKKTSVKVSKPTTEEKVPDKPTNEELEKKILEMGYTIVFSKDNKPERSYMSFISLKADDHEIFSNTRKTYGIFNKNGYLVSESARKGFYNPNNEAVRCEYNFKNKRKDNCNKEQLAEIKALDQKYNHVLDNLGINRKEFEAFLHYEFMKEQEKFYALSKEERLLRLGFRLENNLYIIDDFPYGIGNNSEKVAIDLVNHKMMFMEGNQPVTLDYLNHIIYATHINQEITTCKYTEYNTIDCSEYPDSQLDDYYARAFIRASHDFQKDTGIKLEENR